MRSSSHPAAAPSTVLADPRVSSNRAFPIPRSLRSLRAEGVDDWIASLPEIVASLAERWELELGAPFEGGVASWVAPATRRDGSASVLKVSWPHREARHEAAALRDWAGNGAVELFEDEPAHWALLVERCTPGTKLDDARLPADRALAIGAGLLERLWCTPPSAAPYEHLADVTTEWAALVRERMERFRPPFDGMLVAVGAALLETLPQTATRSVLVHGDFNPGNVLASQREPWLVIDVKPMVGDPCYDPWPLLVQVDPPFDHPDPLALLAERYAFFAELTGEPSERLAAWSVARCVESALGLVSTGDLTGARLEMDQAVTLARVAGL